MTPEMLAARVSGQSIALAEPIGGSMPEWTTVEFGWGCSGLQDPYCIAFRYRHGRDGSVYGALRGHLRHAAERLAWRQKWKRRIRGIAMRQYLDEIVQWVMAEELMSFPDRQRLLTVLIGAFPEGVYETEFAPKQRRIAMVLDRWNSVAHEHVARRIREDYEPEYDLEYPAA